MLVYHNCTTWVVVDSGVIYHKVSSFTESTPSFEFEFLTTRLRAVCLRQKLEPVLDVPKVKGSPGASLYQHA
jgi:hypothetical protein